MPDKICGAREAPKLCIDLFAGLGGFSQAFEEADDWEVITVEIDADHDPDIVADVFDLRPTDFEVDGYETVVVLAGHPCTCFSTASLGHHFEGGEPQTDDARDAIAMVYHTVGLIHGIDPDYWFMENPRGQLRSLFKEPECTVWLCQYGRDFAKPTDLWGKHPDSFEPKTCYRGNEDCDHAKTKSYQEGGEGSKERQGVLTEEDSSTRARLPYGLSKAILDAVEAPKSKQSKVDAFA